MRRARVVEFSGGPLHLLRDDGLNARCIDNGARGGRCEKLQERCDDRVFAGGAGSDGGKNRYFLQGVGDSADIGNPLDRQ